MRARLVVDGCAGLYVVGLALLVLGVFAEPPGVLGSYADPHAWWPVTVQVFLAALGFGTWWWINRQRSRAFSLIFLSLGTLTVLVLGSVAYASCPGAEGSSGWKVVIRIMSLVLNNYDTSMFGARGCPAEPPLGLQFARLAQVVVLLVAAAGAVVALLRTQFDRIVVRLAPQVNLVIGADDDSARLLPSLSQTRGRAVRAVITQDPTQPWVQRARTAGWRVVPGDPEDVATVRPLLVGNGRRSLRRVTVLAADSVRVQRLMGAVEAAVRDSRADAPVRALLRIDDAWQAEDWRRRYLGRTEKWIVDTISENEVTARLLVDDAVARGARTLVVVGHSALTFALLGEVAQQMRERTVLEDASPPVTVVLVDAESASLLEEHALAQARFGNGPGVEVHLADQPEVLAAVQGVVTAAPLAAVVFSGESDPADQRLAARLGATHPHLLVYARRAAVAGVGPEPLLAQVRAYGMTLEAGVGHPVDRWERIARLAHERFIRAYPEPGTASRRPWDDGLPEFYRESNIRQVLSTLTAAVELGRSWGASGTDASPPSADQLEGLARKEHESWRRHLLAQGWRWAAARDDAARRHPQLVSWEELPEDGRKKAREGVTGTLALLATLGYRSFDDPRAGWRPLRRRGEVLAVRRTRAWTWTLEDGTAMRGEPGDWEVSDPRGARSVRSEAFDLTHEHIEGDRWRRTGEVEGRPAEPGEVVQSLEGTVSAGVDTWVLRGAAGEEWLVSADALVEGYEVALASPAARTEPPASGS